MDTKDLVKQMMINVLDGNAVEAQERFEDIIFVKMTDALETRKMELAGSTFGPAHQEEE